MDLPLQDVRVLAVEQFGAGPWATLQLADMGAEVIKIEDPAAGGDVGRYVPPFHEGEDSLLFETFNPGKRSISLDLRKPAGREAFTDLVRHSDAVFSNLRGDGPEKLGLTYDDLSSVNPAIVCVSLSGFGATGPRVREGGYDYTMQALAGWMSLTGEPDGPPTKSGLSLDYSVPFQLFATADGHITVAAAKQNLWVAYCHAIGRADLLSDSRFVDFAARDRHRDELLPRRAPSRAPEHTDELLRGLCGFDDDRIADLTEGGAFGDSTDQARAVR